MNATVDVVVSWPANSSVITSSRTWRSLSALPSPSRASSSRLNTSSPRSPLARRRAISAYTTRSSARAARCIRAHGVPGPRRNRDVYSVA